MSRISAKSHRAFSRGGFTLVEVIVAVALSGILFAGILGGFTFLGRNLTRLMNAQEQEAKSRRAFYLLGQDISAAKKIELIESTATTEKLRLSVPGSTNPVEYLYDK